MSIVDFVVIGPGRSGSTWLYHILDFHPDVHLAEGVKELNYFNLNWSKGTNWYESYFKSAKTGSIKGEISNTYLYSPLVPKRMKQVIPDAKLISVVRNPIDRILSVYNYRKRSGELSGSFEEAIAYIPEILTINFYFTQLSWFYREFSSDQINVFLYDDLKLDEAAFRKSIYSFLNVEDSFVPIDAGVKVNEASTTRLPFLASNIKCLSKFMRRHDLLKILEYAKYNKLVRSILYRKLSDRDRVEITQELRQELIKVYRDDILSLGDLINRDLSSWLG